MSRIERWCPRVFPPLLLLLVSLIPVLPWLAAPGNLGVDDWDQHTFYSAVPRDTLLRFHQLPFWNPYYCGGNVLLANPQSRFASPSFLLVLLFGTLPGIKLEIFAHLLVGMLGMYWFARKLGLRRPAAVMPALVFMMGGVFPSHITVGHTWIMAFAYLPFVLLAQEKSVSQIRHALWGAALLALMILEGGTYAYPHSLMALCGYAAATAIRSRSFRPLGGALIMVPLSLLLSGFRLFPLLDLYRQVPRLVESTDALNITALYQVFLDRSCHPWGSYYPGQYYGWHEYGAYLGLIPVTLGLAGMFFLFRRDWRTIPLAVAFFVLALGDFASWSPWHLLHQVPPFSSHRAPSRFLFSFLLFFGLWAGYALDRLVGKFSGDFGDSITARRPGPAGAASGPASTAYEGCRSWFSRGFRPALVVSLLLFSAADLALVNGRHLEKAFPTPPSPVERQDQFCQVVGHPLFMYRMFLANQGTVHCYEPAMLSNRVLAVESPLYRGEVYLASGRGEAEYLEWSPNRMEIAVRPVKSDFLVVNQNYEHGWRTGEGRAVRDWHGLISVPIGPWHKRIELYFRPRGFLAGAAASILGVFISLWIWMRTRRTARHESVGEPAPGHAGP